MTVGTIQPEILGSGQQAEAAKQVFETTGFSCVENAATVAGAGMLATEALASLDGLRRATRDDDGLRYSAGIADMGPQAKAFLTGPGLIDSLRWFTGQAVRLTSDMSCLTVYEAGDRLGVHLDQPADRCALTVIYYLDCASPAPEAPESGLQLWVYGRDRDSIRGAPCQIIRTRPGRLVFGLGSQVWHERPQLQPGERVIALTTCFELS